MVIVIYAHTPHVFPVNTSLVTSTIDGEFVIGLRKELDSRLDEVRRGSCVY